MKVSATLKINHAEMKRAMQAYIDTLMPNEKPIVGSVKPATGGARSTAYETPPEFEISLVARDEVAT